ncbi:MAG TPA: hypothetical protein VK469_18420, partial [Candidatus Kapabacteria bacterium]|nr:hypothetical protein [Candidatus Kapabacteria bacterium]
MASKKYDGIYGPDSLQEGLWPLYEKVAEAEQEVPAAFKIKDIYCFKDQKHGMKPTEAISFGIVLESGPVIKRAGVMGGISAGISEPNTHESIDDAIVFFNEEIRKNFIGLNVSQSEEITGKIIELDDQFRGSAFDPTRPRFSYIGSEIAVGISMICSFAFAERLGVPLEIVLNYRYNKYCLTHQL